MAELTFEQRQAVERPLQGCVLLAGAGSGKTTVLVERYLRSLAAGLTPSEILTVTFTNAAAAEMRDRIAKRLKEKGEGSLADRVQMSSQMGTIHSFCFHWLGGQDASDDFVPPTSILGEEETARLFEMEYGKVLLQGDTSAIAPLLAKFNLGELHNLFWHAFQNRYALEVALPRTEPDEVPFLSAFEIVFRQVVRSVEAHTVRCGKYGFDDLEAIALRRLSQLGPEKTSLKMILVDEFQDLSPTQWQLIFSLAQGQGNRLFLVGDPKQSIYGFRGADVGVFNQGTRTVLDAGGDTVELTYNFRSHQEVVGYLNAVSPALFEGTSVPFSAMESGRPDFDTASATRTLLFGEADREEEVVAASIAQQIEMGIAPESIAVLFRASLRIPLFSEALKRRGIAVRTTQAISALKLPDIVDTMAYFRFLTEPHNDLACAEFLRSSYVALSETELEAVALRSEESLFFKWLSASPERVRDLVTLLARGTTSVQEALEVLFRFSNYWPSEGAFWQWVGEFSPQAQLDRVVEGWDALRRLDLTPRFAPDDATSGVTLTTVHGAKGLEYQSVFLVDLGRTSPPSLPTLRVGENGVGFRYRGSKEKISSPEFERLNEVAKAREAQESKRLLYVALTRAKDFLTIVLPEKGKLPKGSWGEFLKIRT